MARALRARAEAAGNTSKIVSRVTVHSLHDCGMVVVVVNRSMAHVEIKLGVSGTWEDYCKRLCGSRVIVHVMITPCMFSTHFGNSPCSRGHVAVDKSVPHFG